MTEQYDHLGMMCTIRLWHMGCDRLYVCMTLDGFVDMDFVRILSLPGPVNQLDLYQVPDILIELTPTNPQKRNVQRRFTSYIRKSTSKR